MFSASRLITAQRRSGCLFSMMSAAPFRKASSSLSLSKSPAVRINETSSLNCFINGKTFESSNGPESKSIITISKNSRSLVFSSAESETTSNFPRTPFELRESRIRSAASGLTPAKRRWMGKDMGFILCRLSPLPPQRFLESAFCLKSGSRFP